MSADDFDLDAMVDCLKSAAEPSRLRILHLLSGGDLTVSDLTTILSQSQPRVSRHLKLLLEAGLISRWQEGSWALFRLVRSGAKGRLVESLIARISGADPVILRDRERLAEVKARRSAAASEYFSRNATSWDALRKLHVPEGEVEAALLRIAGKGPFNAMLDIGTGTGRMLELFAPHYRSAVGIDANRDMLNIARSNLERAGITSAETRLGDAYNMPVERDAFDLVIVHQVLHFLDDPEAAIREAARSLAPSGKLIVVDFAPHEQEVLRTEHQHHRLGFATADVEAWFRASELQPVAAEALTMKGAKGGALTVMIWVAEDTRYIVAGKTSGKASAESTTA